MSGMTTPVNERNIWNVANYYVGTISGSKDIVYKPVALILDIYANFYGKLSRIPENIKNLAVDASTSLAFAEIPSRVYDVAAKAAGFVKEMRKEPVDAHRVFALGELTSKVSYCVATIFKAAEFLARKGVAMWDATLLKTWNNRFSLVQFSWGILKETENLSRDVPTTVRGRQEKNLSLIKLAFYVSVFTIVAFGAMISSTAILGLSTVALMSCLGMEFYEKLNGLDIPVPVTPGA